MKRFDMSPRSAILVSLLAMGGCSSGKPPQISYDANVPALPVAAAPADERRRPLHVPPSWTPARGGAAEAKEPIARVEVANQASRVQPRR